ncbi:hypothetical protein Taro_050854 [Colocasia esculenta]|uniref:Uncharacterized protein n=1 Tax=Colocasia esculenta TaxID=4460 RepID=A0A843XF30_COLES|nr:hypothetical protein [Colocasia esculenta]
MSNLSHSGGNRLVIAFPLCLLFPVSDRGRGWLVSKLVRGRVHVAFFLWAVTGFSSPSGFGVVGCVSADLLGGRPSDAERDRSIRRVQIRRRHPSHRLLVQKATPLWSRSGYRVYGCAVSFACGGCPACSLFARCLALEGLSRSELVRSHCLSRRWFRSHVVVSGMGPQLGRAAVVHVSLFRRVRAEGCFRILFDSAGSAGVVSGPTLVVGRVPAALDGRDWLSLLSLVHEAHPLLLSGGDSLSQEFVAGQLWWRFVLEVAARPSGSLAGVREVGSLQWWLAFQQGSSVSCRRVLLLLLGACATSMVVGSLVLQLSLSSAYASVWSSSMLVLVEVRFPQNCVVLPSGCCCVALEVEVHRLVALCSGDVSQNGAFWRVFPERCLSGSGGGSPRTYLRCFYSSACCSVFYDGPCCWPFGLCVLVKVLPRIAPLLILAEVLPRSARCSFWATVVLPLWFEVCRLVGLRSGRVLPGRLLALLVEVLHRAALCLFWSSLLFLSVEMSCRCCQSDCLCDSLLGCCRSRCGVVDYVSGRGAGQFVFLFIFEFLSCAGGTSCVPVVGWLASFLTPCVLFQMVVCCALEVLVAVWCVALSAYVVGVVPCVCVLLRADVVVALLKLLIFVHFSCGSLVESPLRLALCRHEDDLGEIEWCRRTLSCVSWCSPHAWSMSRSSFGLRLGSRHLLALVLLAACLLTCLGVGLLMLNAIGRYVAFRSEGGTLVVAFLFRRRHLRGRILVIRLSLFSWDPHPREPIEGVLRATSMLELAAELADFRAEGKTVVNNGVEHPTAGSVTRSLVPSVVALECVMFLPTWLLSVSCGDTWLFLPDLVERVHAEGCFCIVFDSTGSAGVVSGPTLVVGRGITLFRWFFLLLWLEGTGYPYRALFARLTPLLFSGRDSL